MEINTNTIRLLRALTKLSSALNDSDELQDYPEYRHLLKKDVNFFSEWLEEYIKEPINAYIKSDSDCMMGLIDLYNSYDEKIFIKDGFTTSVNLFLAKLSSAYNDLAVLEEPYFHYMSTLKNKLQTIIEKKYFTTYINYNIDDNYSFSEIVDSMDQVGESIINI